MSYRKKVNEDGNLTVSATIEDLTATSATITNLGGTNIILSGYITAPSGLLTAITSDTIGANSIDATTILATTVSAPTLRTTTIATSGGSTLFTLGSATTTHHISLLPSSDNSLVLGSTTRRYASIATNSLLANSIGMGADSHFDLTASQISVYKQIVPTSLTVTLGTTATYFSALYVDKLFPRTRIGDFVMVQAVDDGSTQNVVGSVVTRLAVNSLSITNSMSAQNSNFQYGALNLTCTYNGPTSYFEVTWQAMGFWNSSGGVGIPCLMKNSTASWQSYVGYNALTGHMYTTTVTLGSGDTIGPAYASLTGGHTTVVRTPRLFVRQL